MPRTSEWTDLLGDALIEQIDAVGEELKAQLGWPPLGKAELSASGARRRARADASLLADFLSEVGPELALEILKTTGVELIDRFGEQVVSRALNEAGRRFSRPVDAGGREVFVEGGGANATG